MGAGRADATRRRGKNVGAAVKSLDQPTRLLTLTREAKASARRGDWLHLHACPAPRSTSQGSVFVTRRAPGRILKMLQAGGWPAGGTRSYPSPRPLGQKPCGPWPHSGRTGGRAADWVRLGWWAAAACHCGLASPAPTVHNFFVLVGRDPLYRTIDGNIKGTMIITIKKKLPVGTAARGAIHVGLHLQR